MGKRGRLKKMISCGTQTGIEEEQVRSQAAMIQKRDVKTQTEKICEIRDLKCQMMHKKIQMEGMSGMSRNETKDAGRLSWADIVEGKMVTPEVNEVVDDLDSIDSVSNRSKLNGLQLDFVETRDDELMIS